MVGVAVAASAVEAGVTSVAASSWSGSGSSQAIALIAPTRPSASSPNLSHPCLRIARRLPRWFPVTMENAPAAEKVPQPEGIAGYVSPYPYLDLLQDKMEERLERKVPAAGRFCGYCYGRLRQEDASCPFCGTPTAHRPAVNAIPQEALRAYLAKWKTEERWVHMGAFLGLLVASALFLLVALYGPGPIGH